MAAQQPHSTQPPTDPSHPSVVAVVQQPPSVPQQPVVTQPTITGAPSITPTPPFVPANSSPSIPGQSTLSLVVSMPTRVLGTQPSEPSVDPIAQNPGSLPPVIPETTAASGHPSVLQQVPDTIGIDSNAAPVTQAPPVAAPPMAPAATDSTVDNQGVIRKVKTIQSGPKATGNKWMDVAHTKNTSFEVKCYYLTNQKLPLLEPDTPLDNVPEFINQRVELKPGVEYKFRVAAINSLGRGPWSEITISKTCLEGYPLAPASTKILKSQKGISISWQQPANSPGSILENSVFIAVKPPSNAQEPNPEVTNLYFQRVYRGPLNSCVVPTTALDQALVDTDPKPAIIFRIAAKNDKGYGQATQIRWLQESPVASASPKPAILKRAAPSTPSASGNKEGRADRK